MDGIHLEYFHIRYTQRGSSVYQLTVHVDVFLSFQNACQTNSGAIRCLLKSFKLNLYKKSMTNPKYLCNSRPGILQHLTLQIVQRRLQSKTGQLPGRLLHISVSDIASRRHLRTVSRHHLTVGLPLYRLSTFGLLCHRSGTLYRTVSHSRRSAAAAAAAAAAASCNY